MREMGGFGLGWDAQSGRSVTGKTRDGVERRCDHPIGVIFLDCRLDRSLKPCLVLLNLRTVELIENL